MMMDPYRYVDDPGIKASEAFKRLAEAMQYVGEKRVSKHRKAREMRFIAKQRRKNEKKH